jgi:putative ABC transport system permease protein
MKLNTLILRNLVFFRRTNLAIIAGVAIAVAVLSGALQTGVSIRQSLRALLFERLGSTEFIATSSNFFGANLAKPFEGFTSCPIIYLKGTVIHEGTRVRVHDVNVYGIDERFWNFHGLTDQAPLNDRSALAGSGLASQLDLHAGDNLLLKVETQQSIPKEWLYGRRDSMGRTIRLNCRGILAADRLGEFALRPTQASVSSIFVPLKRLQKDLEQSERINAILLAKIANETSVATASGGASLIQNDLRKRCTLDDLGLKLRNLPSGNGFSLESSRIILDDSIAQTSFAAAQETGLAFNPLYTYLANSIRANGREIPYSVVTAADIDNGKISSVPPTGSMATPSSIQATDESIWLTDWSSRDLDAKIGDLVEIDYYFWLDSGRLVTRTARFRFAGVISKGFDASFAPEIPGITEAQSIGAWDPPFPLDLGRIRHEDEDFWNRYKATPKAFITLSRGQELWKNRFGKLTAIRFVVPNSLDQNSVRNQFATALLRRLPPQQAGLVVTSIKEQGVAASQGSTDFGEYFAYFSSFLMLAAILLAILFFKLMVEQRVREIGILRAAGYPLRTLQRIFLLEGILLSVVGSIVGLIGSLGYGWLMIFGLRTWWSEAVGTHRLHFHASWNEVLIGSLAGAFFSVIAILWTLRGLRRNSLRSLLAGVLESTSTQHRRARALGISSIAAAISAAGLLLFSSFGKISQLEGFFGSGFLLMLSMLCATAWYLRRRDPKPLRGSGWPAFLRLGIRNAMHRPGRSLICASLIASAIFIVISMEAFRQDSRNILLEPKSGTGGYPLVAESALPIVYDLNSDAGRENTGLSGLESSDLAALKFVPFRERPGDDASCLNLYAPQEPKILGAPSGFLAAGRFAFQDSLASDDRKKANPWLLLDSSLQDAVIPAIADANTIQYILHLSLGSEVTIRRENGSPVRLRLVAALKDSIFQGELLISESNFLRLFPENQGYRFFLLDVQKDRAAKLMKGIQEALSDFDVRIESSQKRLSDYHRVENAYLSTFQSLGSLGLILGTLGLSAVLLRNVLERRQELAILQAVGYRRRILSSIILSENMVLVCWGLISGSVCAFLAVIPAFEVRGGSFPFAASGLILISVLGAGLFSSVFAVVAALRSSLLSSLHTE